MAKSKKVEEPEVESAEPEVVEQRTVLVGTVNTPVLPLTPKLVEIIHANRFGRATNSDLQALWLALYAAVGPAPKPVARTFGK